MTPLGWEYEGLPVEPDYDRAAEDAIDEVELRNACEVLNEARDNWLMRYATALGIEDWKNIGDNTPFDTRWDLMEAVAKLDAAKGKG